VGKSQPENQKTPLRFYIVRPNAQHGFGLVLVPINRCKYLGYGNICLGIVSLQSPKGKPGPCLHVNEVALMQATPDRIIQALNRNHPDKGNFRYNRKSSIAQSQEVRYSLSGAAHRVPMA
jgi:hypothetical protein